MSEIKNLTDKNGIVIHPKTVGEAIDINGEILTTYTNEIVSSRGTHNTLNDRLDSMDEDVQRLKDNVINNSDSYYIEYHPEYLNAYYINYKSGILNEYNNTMTACDYLELDKNADTFVIENLNYDANDLAGLAFYNQDKVYISGYQYNKDVTVSVSVPSNAVYVRFTVKTAKLSGITAVYGKKDATVDINTVTESITNLENKLTDLENIKKTILNPVFTTSYYINYKNGVFNPHNDKFSACDFLQLDKDSNILIIKNLNYNGNDLAGLAFYNQDKVYISGYQYNYDTDIKLEVPSNAVYVRFTVKTENVNAVSVLNITTLKDSVNNLLEKIDNIGSSDTEDDYDYCQIFHKIAGIGDSLMSGELAYYNESGERTYVDCINYSWLSNLCKNIGAEPVHYSRGGLTTKTWLEKKLSEMQAETILPSAYYIALGTNDATNSAVALGSIEDCGTDNDTFYAYYSKIITNVQAFNPNAKIFCCSIYFVSLSISEEVAQSYSNAIKEMCNQYGCYYIDFLNNYGQNYTSSSTFISVGHFTSPGYVRVGKEIQKLTNQVISRNQNDFKFVGLNHIEI